MSEGEVILYRTDDGSAQFRLTKLDGTVWINQIKIAERYQTSKQVISHHIRNSLAEGEVAAEATVNGNLTVQTKGRRQVSRSITYSEVPHLNGSGRINDDTMKCLAHDRYDEFDHQRKQQNAIAADAADLEKPKAIKDEVSKTRKGSGR